MLNLILADVQPLLRQLTASETPRVEFWVKTLSAVLNARYGSRITPDNQDVFTFYVAEAIARKLANPNPHILSESVEGASVTYAANSTRGDLFLPSEIQALDSLVGLSGIRTIRTPAPDAIRFA